MATHRSPQEWSKILRAYEKRNVTQAQFCLNHNISVGALCAHRRKRAEVKKHPSIIELPQSTASQPHKPGWPQSPDCQIECYYEGVGPVKVNCSSGKLALVLEQLANRLKQEE